MPRRKLPKKKRKQPTKVTPLPPQTAQEAELAAAAEWWTKAKEEAYLALLEGESPSEVARKAGVPRRTLYDWRQHAFWKTRLTEESARRHQAHEEALLAADVAAIRALRNHVSKDPTAAMEHLHRRGILPKPKETGPSVVVNVGGADGIESKLLPELAPGGAAAAPAPAE